MSRKKEPKMSDREKWAAKTGKSKEEYDGGKKKDKKKDKKSSSSLDKTLRETVKSILNVTPAQQEVLPDFESVYSKGNLNDTQRAALASLRPDVVAAYGNDVDKINKWWNEYGIKEMPDYAANFGEKLGKNDAYSLEQEDYKASTEAYNGFYEDQIKKTLEDLNAWNENNIVDYNRALRRARFTYAQEGAAIGTERQTGEKEMSDDNQKLISEKVKGVERLVGTNNITARGWQTQEYNEGSINAERTKAIAEGQLWYKGKRQNKYYGNAETYYSQPTNASMTGKPL